MARVGLPLLLLALALVAAVRACDPVFQTRVMLDELAKTNNMTAVLAKYASPKVRYQIQDVTGKLDASYVGPAIGYSALLALEAKWQSVANQTERVLDFFGAPGSPRCLVIANDTITWSSGKSHEIYIQAYDWELGKCILQGIWEMDDTLLLYTILSSQSKRV